MVIITKCPGTVNSKTLSDFTKYSMNILCIFISIKKYIDQNYSNQLNLPYIASEFHLSEPYLSRKFKAKFDINIIQYIKLVRIRHAKQLLMSSGKKISEISLLVGYDDEKYFSRVFKEMEKISANDYRKKFSYK